MRKVVKMMLSHAARERERLEQVAAQQMCFAVESSCRVEKKVNKQRKQR